MTVPLHRVRGYEDLDGAQGREVFFRPHRYRAGDLAPLKAVARVRTNGHEVICQLLDVSQNGVAIEWPPEVAITVGDKVPHVSLKFDDFEAYAGEARIGSIREAGNAMIVGLSFEGPLVSMDDVLELRTIKAFAEETAQAAAWHAPGLDRFKVLVSELRLFLEDSEQKLARLEKQLPWHVLHGEGGPARVALMERIKETIVADIVRTTEEIDAAVRSVPPTQTQPVIQWSRRHLHEFFMQSPSMHRCAVKPFGYPGDYEVMRFIYEKPFEGPTLFAKTIGLAFDQTRAARAVRHRKDLVKRQLKSLIESRGRPLRVLAVACGPAQELVELLDEVPEMPAPLEIVLFDQDKGALAYAYRRLMPMVANRPGAPVKVVYLHESIKRLLRDGHLFDGFGKFDLIYSVGLFDYLRQTTAVALARNLVGLLAEGGRAVIANMVPENPSRWYMEHHLDWWLIYRSRQEMLEIAARAAPEARRQILEEESGVNPFVEIARE